MCTHAYICDRVCMCVHIILERYTQIFRGGNGGLNEGKSFHCLLQTSLYCLTCFRLAVTLAIKIILAIKKNTFEAVLMRWMKLEPIIQSEVSQKEKHQYSILTHIYGI